MHFVPNLEKGILLKRYKRFLIDVRLNNGDTVTAHCANSGSMLGLIEEGRPVYLAQNTNPKAKNHWRWELLKINDVFVGVNTFRTNKIVEQGIIEGKIPELKGYKTLKKEVKYAENSRIDILLQEKSQNDCYVEIKNCTLCRTDGLVEFPDCITARGRKHLYALEKMVDHGYRAVMIYLLNRTDASYFGIAKDIDRAYYKAYQYATNRGVEVYAYKTKIHENYIEVAHKIGKMAT